MTVKALRERLADLDDDAPVFAYLGGGNLTVQAEPAGERPVVFLKAYLPVSAAGEAR